MRHMFHLILLSVWTLVLGAASMRADDWPHFLGPRYDLHSAETGLNLDFPETGPRLLWEVERGRGHAGPVISGDKVVFLHQIEDREQIRCVSAETGKTLWEFAYEVKTDQSYGVVDAPRSSPVIDPKTATVYSLGNDGDLVCLALSDGHLIWRLSLPKEFGKSPNFFGYGSSPLVDQDRLIVNVGTPEACVVAFNKKDGTILWKTAHKWGGSYSSPIVARLHGQEKLLVYAAGKSKPPVGGLLCLDPETGRIDSEFAWRSSNFTSIVAASPVACGDRHVFITEDYGLGGVMVEYDDRFQPRLVWPSPEFGCQFQTPIYHDGVIYGAGGNGGLMLAFDAASGRHLWNEPFYQTKIEWQGRPVSLSLGHAHLIHVDGHFLCLGEDGALLCLTLDASGYQIRSKARLFYAPEAWAPPVISGGRLYIMQNEFGPRLLCYDLRKSGDSATSAPEAPSQTAVLKR